MLAQDLAKWDISIIDQKVMKSSSYAELEREGLLKNGLATGYGLGVKLENAAGHRQISHSGEVSGFTAQNIVLPDDRVAVAVLTNQDAARAADQIANGIAPLLVASNDPATPAKQEEARKVFEGLQHGSIERSLFTDNANAYFGEQALKDFAAGLGPLKAPQEFVQVRQDLRGGMTLRVYRVKFAQKTLRAWTYEMPDGKLEQYQIAPED